MTNALYYGDNLRVLRESIASESADLIYLDPPFNSQATYNVLFKSPAGKSAEAQIEAFEDTWHWGEESEQAFDEVLNSANTYAAEMLRAMRSFLGENDMMAYLAMMAVRLLELHRVLKPTGSLYLHCDPTASHYLKLLLDAIFGVKNYRNEVIWDYSFRLMDLPRFFNRKHDVIFFYAKSNSQIFNMPKTEWTREDIIKTRKQEIHVDENGTEWIWMPGGKGHSKNKLKKIDDIIKEGKAISDVWQIPVISSSSKERLGYPTQKPLTLLERIIQSSSKPGDVVLDPFCGCGTAVHAAEKLGRRWIGIDITCLAIGLIERRLKDAFPGIAFEAHGTPKTLQDAVDLAERDKYQFQWWAASAVGARPYAGKKKGADGGIDGILFFKSGAKTTESVIISVKGGNNVGVGAVRDLHSVIEREKAAIGVLITAVLPTRAMQKEAAAVGLYDCGLEEKFPRLQLITLAELFQGKRPRIPLVDTAATFRTAAREDLSISKQRKLDL